LKGKKGRREIGARGSVWVMWSLNPHPPKTWRVRHPRANGVKEVRGCDEDF
jgi:hypothetical protein